MYRVQLLVNRFPSLSETFVADQLRSLLERGVRVDVRATAPQAGAAGFEHPRLRVTYWPSTRAERAKALARLGPVGYARAAAWRRRRVAFSSAPELAARAGALDPSIRYDLILAHFGTQGLDAELYRRMGRLSGPLAVVFHGFDLSRFVRDRGERVYRTLLEGAELLLPVSERWRDQLQRMGAARDKLRVHRMGVSCEAIPFRPRRWTPGARLELLSVARLVEKKGLQHALPVVGALAREMDVVWRVVGDGPMRGELEALAARHRAPVVFCGAQPRSAVAERLAQAHLLLAPSVTAADGDQEGIPVAIMEAMAQGLVVVTTRHSGIPELVKDGVTGFLAEEGDEASLLEALRRAAARPEAWPSLSASARQKVEADFDQAEWNARLFEIVERFAQRKGNPCAASCT